MTRDEDVRSVWNNNKNMNNNIQYIVHYCYNDYARTQEYMTIILVITGDEKKQKLPRSLTSVILRNASKQRTHIYIYIYIYICIHIYVS